jgi:hypothetical protein
MCDVSLAPNILMQRSFGGTFVFLEGVALIMYVAKLQPTMVTSIGEGEFIQLVLTGKKIKHVHTVMTELAFPQRSPSPIFGDNISSILMGKISILRNICSIWMLSGSSCRNGPTWIRTLSLFIYLEI